MPYSGYASILPEDVAIEDIVSGLIYLSDAQFELRRVRNLYFGQWRTVRCWIAEFETDNLAQPGVAYFNALTLEQSPLLRLEA